MNELGCRHVSDWDKVWGLQRGRDPASAAPSCRVTKCSPHHHPISRAAGHAFASEPGNPSVLGRSLGREQTHVASCRGETPGTSDLHLGSKRKHRRLQHKQWKKGASTAAQGGRTARERPLWTEGVLLCPAKTRGNMQGNSGKNLTQQLQGAHYHPAPHKACWESTGKEKGPLAQESY